MRLSSWKQNGSEKRTQEETAIFENCCNCNRLGVITIVLKKVAKIAVTRLILGQSLQYSKSKIFKGIEIDEDTSVTKKCLAAIDLE